MNSRLHAITQELMEAYVRQRRVTNRRYTLGRSRYSLVWTAIAEQVESLGADSTQFVNAQFITNPRRRPPLPEDLYGPSAIHQHESHNGPQGSAAASLFAYCEGDLSRLVQASGFSVDDFVCCPASSYSPLFRLALCSEEKFPEMLELLGEAARRQLAGDRPLVRYLQRYHPARAAVLIGPQAPEPAEPNGSAAASTAAPAALACAGSAP